jgi:hypothetical protein
LDPAPGAAAPTASAKPIGVSANLLRKGAPLTYTVTTRDTVVGIAKKYLTRLSYWPQLFGARELSTTQLFVGDTLRLITLDQRKILVVDRASAATHYEKLTPQLKEMPMDMVPIIATKRLKSLFNHPQLFAESEFVQLPFVVASENVGQMYYTAGDVIYVKGQLGDPGARASIFSNFRALVDPDTQESLGYEVRYNGEGVVEQNGAVSSVRLTNTVNQVGNLDRVTVLSDQLEPEIIPHKSAKLIQGKIIALYDALTATAENNTVVINRGQRDGVEVGQVFDINDSRQIVDPSTNRDRPLYITLPAQVIGEVLIYKVYDKVAFGLVTDSSKPIAMNANVQSQY